MQYDASNFRKNHTSAIFILKISPGRNTVSEIFSAILKNPVTQYISISSPILKKSLLMAKQSLGKERCERCDMRVMFVRSAFLDIAGKCANSFFIPSCRTWRCALIAKRSLDTTKQFNKASSWIHKEVSCDKPNEPHWTSQIYLIALMIRSVYQ